MNNSHISKSSVTIKQVSCDDAFYKTIEKEFEENDTNAKTFWNLLYGEDTRRSSPRLLAISVEGQLMGYVVTFDFFQATYITCLQINEAHRGEGFGSMLLQHVCKEPNRTFVLLTDVAMSDSEQLAVCVRRKMFYLKNGFRTVPVKWHSEYYYKYDVHVKGPDLELGSLLAVLRKGREIWNTAYLA
ncbi:MAG: GNAT family N-acetyltransferase [Prevotella sp.]|nr:GNAT family N-acetyltransferase [Prevotella sp.]